ncbi:biotin--[acetyl-CoA-carboxylase] ligase [Myroides marinus]|uniref:biotin--[acetyl-CoA-carboxylase] ligase n=1 Tax=Myroides marinus TaxID=703342 RepID=UPI00257686F5|nr:biotin--[acetyl-CoA-carboxylase] ligase [Myroides marinus]MDM1346753.1 biotin--[acetyl-CoA-carboxylase] ligase [Myroides marinus]MDM1350430.1 biotin--[acetyl-CoA-carboxylase] ligase [Myroides marinus]MDM1357637.1 biotin--[acetyl-CoA-carboxylase] ligase [Myroides marinus]MDM1361528.1 biotin--[acetyl-CoA-carboxylase] ligase [Myroides marinus]MDM1365072.1 biotin--[acetyl-CoA-carboxylase] ligase [Myroides marinus]
MNIIKLDAIGSTNTYLKEILTHSNLENFTVVVTENQFQGKGQRGSVWVDEKGSSLTFSVLVKDLLSSPEYVFDLNILVALSVQQSLIKMLNLPFNIKWPNDILSYNKKIGGILIENIIKATGETLSVVGIGINVNQEDFSHLPQATSLYKACGHKIDKEELMYAIIDMLTSYCDKYRVEGSDFIWEEYKRNLYRINVPSAFELPSGERFMGIIVGVTRYGLLEVKKEDDSVELFEIKQLKLLY